MVAQLVLGILENLMTWWRLKFQKMVLQTYVLPGVFKRICEAITKGNPMWDQLSIPASTLYSWSSNSTYIHEPPYFKNMTMEPRGLHGIKDSYCLLNFGDGVTTDHISHLGSIPKDSPATKYLIDHELMVRGTFAKIRLVNKLLNGEVGPKTIHIPTGEKLMAYDAAMRYKAAGQDTIILAGADY